ncbi:MAG: hypothetical protein LBU40_05385 [Methanobrevibacter sp.]|jgi:hypothetical protein|nr:hypothetical protein [Methanobrevibacter sp.]
MNKLEKVEKIIKDTEKDFKNYKTLAKELKNPTGKNKVIIEKIAERSKLLNLYLNNVGRFKTQGLITNEDYENKKEQIYNLMRNSFKLSNEEFNKKISEIYNFTEQELEKYEIDPFFNGYGLYNYLIREIEKINNINSFDEFKKLIIKVEYHNISDNFKAKIYKLIAEKYLEFNNKLIAINYYEKALKFYPKIGVKRKYDKLRKELNLN